MINSHKVSLILLLLSFFAADAFAKNLFSILGSVPPVYDGVQIKLSSDNPTFQPLITKAKNGKFNFSSEIGQEYEHVYLTVKKDDENLGWWGFFIKGGRMEIKILNLKDKNFESNIRYSNVPFIEEQEKYNTLIKPVQDSLIFAFNLLLDVTKAPQSRYNKDSLTITVRALRIKILNKKIKFIKAYSNAFIGLYIFKEDVVKYPFNEFIISQDSLMSIYSAFDKSLKETNLGKSVYTYLFKKQSFLLNKFLPDFSFSTNKGHYYSLHSFHNKYILLCFWDSWCSPCIKSIPLLKALAKKYEGKALQMISVSFDNNEGKWLSSLLRYNLPWLQTCDLPKYNKGASISALYDVHFIPQYFLIDKKGRLIYQNVQLKDSDDYNILQKMLEHLLN